MIKRYFGVKKCIESCLKRHRENMEEREALSPWLLKFKVSHSGYLRASQVRSDIIDTGEILMFLRFKYSA